MNEHVVDLVALYALDGLEPDERRAVEAHLAVCGLCQAEAAREQATVAALTASVPAQAPDPRLRALTLGRVGVRSSKPARPARGPVPKAADRGVDPQQGWLRLPRWVPMVLSLALAVLAGWNVYLTGELNTLRRQVAGTTSAVALITSPVTEAIPLTPAEGDPAPAHGHAYVNTNSQAVVLVVQELTPLATGQTYQAWLMTDEGAVSAGLFDVTKNGWGMTWLQVPFRPGAVIGVSREPAGGSETPTEVVLVGGL
jgi:anti-sigma-K factor RskA